MIWRLRTVGSEYRALEPTYVRGFLAVTVAIFGTILVYTDKSLLVIFAFSGIVMTTVGAGLLYRGSVIDEEYIALKIKVILGGKSLSINSGEKTGLIFNAGCSMFLYIVFTPFVLNEFKNKEFILALFNAVVGVSYASLPLIITFVSLKLARLVRLSRAKKIDELESYDQRAAFIKREYRAYATLFLILGAWLQVPLLFL